MKTRLIGLGMATAVGLALASVPAAAQEKVKVAIGQMGLWDTLITVFAKENGYYRELGLNVDTMKTAGGGETAQLIITGDVQFGMTIGVLSAISTFAKGAPMKIVSSEIIGTPDVFWYVRTDSKLTKVEDINGASIAYSRPGSGTHLTLLTLAAHLKLSPKLVSAGEISATRTQVMSGQVDAGWSVPPFGLDMVQKGEARVLFRGEIVTPLNDISIRVNVANATWLAKNRETARKFMIGYQRALDWMYGAGKEEAIARFARFNNLDIAVAREAVTYYPKTMIAIAPLMGLDKAVGLALEHKMIREPLTDAQKKELVDIVYDPRSS
ncbi:MAG: ABC transporter substrate-binding protein [Alphaproteobacteria bacterium]|nr:ABC transporter substrate-binding protein [Alphaproteobacteria bacterium]